MVFVGLSVGPSLGGFLTTGFGWRSIFLVNVGVGLLIIATTLLKVRDEWAEGATRSFDVRGSAMYSLMLLALMYGMSMLPNEGAYPYVLGGLVLLGTFIYHEMRVENPILDVNLFLSNRAFSFSNLAAFINFSATYAITLLLSMYLQYIKALDAQQAGIVMMASPITQAIISPVAGRLSDRVEPHKIAAVGMAVTTLSLLPFLFLGDGTPLTYVAGSLGLLGVGLALFTSPNTNAIMGSVERRLYGVASSTVGTMRLTGQMISTGVAMTLFAINLGGNQILPELYPLLLSSVRTTFTVFFVVCIPGIAASMVKGRLTDNEKV
jgi:MFS family permease